MGIIFLYFSIDEHDNSVNFDMGCGSGVSVFYITKSWTPALH